MGTDTRTKGEVVVPLEVPDEKTSRASKEEVVVGMLASRLKLEVPELLPVSVGKEKVQTIVLLVVIIDKASSAPQQEID